MHHAGELGASTALDIDDGAHGGTSTGESAEEAGDSVADALPYQFTVAVVLGLSDIVGHNRGEEGVDRAKSGQGQSGDDSGHEDGDPIKPSKRYLAVGEERHRDTGGYFTDDGHTIHIDKERDNGHYEEGHQCGWHFFGK